MISRIKSDLVIPPYYYFIIFDKNEDKFELFTFENRNDLKYCHEIQQLIKINEFSSTISKWMKSPIFPKKYKNFHDCKMVIGVSSYSNFVQNLFYGDGIVLVSGLLADITNIISERLNFTYVFTLCYNIACSERLHSDLYVYNVAIIPTLDGYAMNNPGNYKWRNEMLNIQCV